MTIIEFLKCSSSLAPAFSIACKRRRRWCQRMLKIFALHSKTNYKHAVADFWPRWISRNVNFGFLGMWIHIFNFSAAPSSPLFLSVCLSEKSPLPCNYLGAWGEGGAGGVTKGEEGMGGHGHWGNILGAGRQIWICDSYTNVLTMQQIIRINSRDSKLHKNAYIYIKPR